MSDYTTLRITRTEPTAADLGDWLRIEQADYEKPTSDGFGNWLSLNGRGYSIDTLMDNWSQYQSQCEDDGSLTVEIRVFKSRPDLQYDAHVSYGALSDRYVHEEKHQESKAVQQANRLDLQVQIVGAISASWEGVVFDTSGGMIVPPPEIVVSNSVLYFGEDEVSGVVRLSYTEEHDAYTLTITPRPADQFEADNPEGAYQSTFFATWAGGVESQDVNLPDNLNSCNYSVKVTSGGQDKEKCVRHNILVDPCTMAVIKEWDEQIACPEDEG